MLQSLFEDRLIDFFFKLKTFIKDFLKFFIITIIII